VQVGRFENPMKKGKNARIIKSEVEAKVSERERGKRNRATRVLDLLFYQKTLFVCGCRSYKS
jgi:hypothetical protein